jgi:hypothetical protein
MDEQSAAEVLWRIGNLAGALVSITGVVIFVYVARKKAIKTEVDRQAAKILDWRFAAFALSGLLYPWATFWAQSLFGSYRIAISDVLYLEAAVFLMLGGFYPILFVIRLKPILMKEAIESAEAAANYWSLGAILFALCFTVFGTFLLTVDNGK